MFTSDVAEEIAPYCVIKCQPQALKLNNLLTFVLEISNSFFNVLLRGPRVFSENDEPQERATPQTRAVSFQDNGKSLTFSGPSMGWAVASGTPFSFASEGSEGSERVSVTAVLSAAVTSPVDAIFEAIRKGYSACATCKLKTENELQAEGEA